MQVAYRPRQAVHGAVKNFSTNFTFKVGPVTQGRRELQIVCDGQLPCLYIPSGSCSYSHVVLRTPSRITSLLSTWHREILFRLQGQTSAKQEMPCGSWQKKRIKHHTIFTDLSSRVGRRRTVMSRPVRLVSTVFVTSVKLLVVNIVSAAILYGWSIDQETLRTM